MSSDQQQKQPASAALPAGSPPVEEGVWHEGSCHCGAVAYKVRYPALDSAAPAEPEGTPAPLTPVGKAASGLPILQQPTRGYACNCSICTRNGYINLYAQRPDIVFSAGGFASLSKYNFNHGVADHLFCATCGSSCFTDLKGNIFPGDVVAVNARMLKDFNIHTITYKLA